MLVFLFFVQFFRAVVHRVGILVARMQWLATNALNVASPMEPHTYYVHSIAPAILNKEPAHRHNEPAHACEQLHRIWNLVNATIKKGASKCYIHVYTFTAFYVYRLHTCYTMHTVFNLIANILKQKILHNLDDKLYSYLHDKTHTKCMHLAIRDTTAKARQTWM